MTMETTSTVPAPVTDAPRAAVRWWQHVPTWMLSPALLLVLWEILARVVVHSLVLTTLMGLLAMLQAYVVPWMVPTL